MDIVAVERLTRPAAGDEGILPTLFIKGELACCEGKRRQDERNWWHASRRRKRG